MSEACNRSTLEDEEKLIILAVGSRDKPITSKIKLQKIMFLISDAIEGLKEDLGYEPHLYGPYSEKVENMSEDLTSLGIINHVGTKFILTQNGKQLFRCLDPAKGIIQLVDDSKEFLNDLTDDEVLTYIYSFYPEYIEESTKWDDLKQSRIERSIKLFKREKLSVSKAAAMAGMNSFDFAALLKDKGVKWRK